MCNGCFLSLHRLWISSSWLILRSQISAESQLIFTLLQKSILTLQKPCFQDSWMVLLVFFLVLFNQEWLKLVNRSVMQKCCCMAQLHVKFVPLEQGTLCRWLAVNVSSPDLPFRKKAKIRHGWGRRTNSEQSHRHLSVWGGIFSLSAWQWASGITFFFQIQQMVLDSYLMARMGWKDPGDRAERMQESSFVRMFSESERCDRLLF